jgi:hypothetical protein
MGHIPAVAAKIIMMRLMVAQRRWAARAAALLLVLRGLGGGALVLAHAAEAPTAPAAIETPQHADCVVVHDALRCAVCHVVAIGVTPVASHAVPAVGLRCGPRPAEPDAVPHRAERTRSAPPRAPPILFA